MLLVLFSKQQQRTVPENCPPKESVGSKENSKADNLRVEAG